MSVFYVHPERLGAALLIWIHDQTIRKGAEGEEPSASPDISRKRAEETRGGKLSEVN